MKNLTATFNSINWVAVFQQRCSEVWLYYKEYLFGTLSQVWVGFFPYIRWLKVKQWRQLIKILITNSSQIDKQFSFCYWKLGHRLQRFCDKRLFVYCLQRRLFVIFIMKLAMYQETWQTGCHSKGCIEKCQFPISDFKGKLNW